MGQFRDDVSRCKAKLELLRGKIDEGSIAKFEEVSKELVRLLLQGEDF